MTARREGLRPPAHLGPADAGVQPPAGLLWPGPAQLAERAGQCYTLALAVLAVNVDARPELARRLYLVHGLLHPELAAASASWADRNPGLPLPPPNPHAWTELDTPAGVAVLDPVLRLVWSVPEHRAQMGAEVVRRWPADVALTIAARRGTCGPWDRRSRAECEARQAYAAADPRYDQQAARDRFTTTA